LTKSKYEIIIFGYYLYLKKILDFSIQHPNKLILICQVDCFKPHFKILQNSAFQVTVQIKVKVKTVFILIKLQINKAPVLISTIERFMRRRGFLAE
jgi:hypothetical protein